MGMKANEIGDWLRRRRAGKRDHHEALRDDYVVIRPGPNFDWFMAGLAAGQPTPSAPEQDSAGNDGYEADPRQQFSPWHRLSRCRFSRLYAGAVRPG
jgi:hypothetical protein